MLHPHAQALLRLIEEKGVPPTHTLTPAQARDFYRERRFYTQPAPPERETGVEQGAPTSGGTQGPGGGGGASLPGASGQPGDGDSSRDGRERPRDPQDEAP